MSRALERYFGVEPKLDIEAQRAIVVLKRPMAIDWKAVDDAISRASFTFNGAHIRARGQASVEGLVFEFSESGQRMPIRDGRNVLRGRSIEIIGMIVDWKEPSHLALSIIAAH